MPSQPRALILPSLLRAAVPGAINLTASQLDGNFIIKIDGQGIPSQQTTLAQLAEFFGGGIGKMPSRVVTQSADAVFESGDVALLINLATPAPLTINLPTPVDPTVAGYSSVIMIKDMARNAGTNAITLNAGAGKLIESQQTLVMNADGEVTVLLSESATQWGVWI